MTSDKWPHPLYAISSSIGKYQITSAWALAFGICRSFLLQCPSRSLALLDESRVLQWIRCWQFRFFKPYVFWSSENSKGAHFLPIILDANQLTKIWFYNSTTFKIKTFFISFQVLSNSFQKYIYFTYTKISPNFVTGFPHKLWGFSKTGTLWEWFPPRWLDFPCGPADAPRLVGFSPRGQRQRRAAEDARNATNGGGVGLNTGFFDANKYGACLTNSAFMCILTGKVNGFLGLGTSNLTHLDVSNINKTYDLEYILASSNYFVDIGVQCLLIRCGFWRFGIEAIVEGWLVLLRIFQMCTPLEQRQKPWKNCKLLLKREREHKHQRGIHTSVETRIILNPHILQPFATRFIPWCLTNESNEWSFLVKTPQSTAPALRLAYFQDDAANVVMSLAKQARWEHAVELAQRRGKRAAKRLGLVKILSIIVNVEYHWATVAVW